MSNKETIKVLMIDGHDRRALACIRSLGRVGGYEIHVGSNRSVNATRYSKYCSKFFSYANPETQIDEFISNVADYVKQNNIDVLIPMGENMAYYINSNIEKLTPFVNILQPEKEGFNIARDKEKTLKIADSIGIPIPYSYTYEQVVENHQKIQFPLLIKPRISSASMGMAIVENYQDFLSQYKKIADKYPNPVVQELIKAGGGHYQLNAVLDRNHNVVCTVVKNKLREFPIYGGPSTFFRTVDYPIIEEYGTKLLKEIKWVGPAEVEFMVDPVTNIPKLMEINPRMSATIALSCYVGVNFPLYITKFALGEKFTETHRNIKFNHFCQWFIPGDFLNFVYNPKRFKQEFGYFGFFRKNLTHMTFDKNDIKPFFINIYIMISSFFSPEKILRYIKRK